MATLIRSDLEFILQQILVAEAHAAGADPVTLVPNTFAPLGLRTVDGSFNNLLPGQTNFGAADNSFPRLVDPVYRDDGDGDQFDLNGPAPGGEVTNTDYGQAGSVADADPRIISNLVADMTSGNPAAVQAFVDAGLGELTAEGILLDLDGNPIPPGTLLVIPNEAPDEGLSAPFNSWFTAFGQFFDHGLDLVNKGGNETIFIPLQPDDPLYVEGGSGNFMVLTRATPNGTEHTNQTTPLVDQNQTYTSHASHQVFLREYALDASGRPVATGRMLDGADGGLPTWAEVKLQARTMLGIELDDLDVLDVPLLATDQYGKFIPDSVTGFPQLVVDAGPPPTYASGTPTAPVDASLALRTGHAFLDDIAHSAKPVSSTGEVLAPDSGTAVGGVPEAGTYDNELLDRHYITGDGRGNENIGLTAVHHVFHSEHNRQAAEIQATILATGDEDFIASWQLPDGSWNGERIFQAARFATEMQYQHLVFEEFARKMQPAIDVFLPETNYDTTIDPAIVAEFAHAVFRVGHSMLTESIDRLSPDFESNDVALIDAFLNPVKFNENGALSADEAAGAIIRGMTRQQGNAIDEFVTDAVRNQLLGLPLDLAAINIARGRDTGIPTLNAARREFYEMTHDSQLKPYTSWADLTLHLKHEASVVNFIAAYGTHAALLAEDVDTVDEKRAVAAALVFGGSATINAGTPEEWVFVADEADRIAFLNSTGEYAPDANGITTTGVDAIDLWIGGLAEKTMPFGGMLGSTFNFVFETQLENLQNGDRFYYLARLAGTNFLTELENNSFSKLVELNTDVTHLPADIFSTPAFTLEVNRASQFTGLGDDGRADPTEGGTALIPLVIRDNPSTPVVETNYLQYTGGDHVVLGGTAGNDTIIASIGDDTVIGDAGNDRLEGGDGNDTVEGGPGDDIITDRGGDDVLKGDAGNDVIHGGNGFNLIIGGDGKDFIVTGEDVSEVFAGQGDDFILGAKSNLPTFGNEGDDWIELGTQDGTTGDSFDPLFQDGIIGNDVLISGGGFDELIGEGGDDIFTGSDGEDHFDGGSGFDWAIYKFERYGVTVDMLVDDFVELPATPSNAGIMDRFAFTEGLSGSPFGDVLRGDDADATQILLAGAKGSVLTNIALIDGLQDILPEGTTSFGAGNIILGGGGSDLIMGRGGNDIIDGDAWLNVRIAVSGHPTIKTVDSMKELVPYMLSGEINPSQLSIVREILKSDTADFDTAVFAGPRANYTVITGLDGVTFVTDNVGTNAGTEGTDTLRNIERLQFADQAVVLVPGINSEPLGALTISDGTPSVNQVLTVSAADIVDADNGGTGSITNGPISFVWQYEPDPVRAPGVFRDILDISGVQPATASGTNLRVTADLAGLALRARAVYQDANGVLENVYSAPTAPVAGTLPAPPAPSLPSEALVPSTGVRYIQADLQFILDQIIIAERHAAGEDLLDVLPNSRVAFGLRTVDGSLNNLVQRQTEFGGADTLFPRLLDPAFRNDLDGDEIDLNGPAPGGVLTNTDYGSATDVVDADPRIISNLIVDQTENNPAAVGLGAPLVPSPGRDGIFGTADDTEVLFIPNTTPDEGLSAPFNAWFTFFGQFFDHGLDFVNKGGNGTIFIPLQPDDPLFDPAPGAPNFLVLTRSTQFNGPGPDGILGDDPSTAVDESLDDTTHEAANATTSFVDQNQTYTSHPSHQVFLREYAFNDAEEPVATGRLITNRNLGADKTFGNLGEDDDIDLGGMATWAIVKAQARDMLGIALDDLDALNLPLLAADAYGNFIPDPETGFAQIVLATPGGPLDMDGNGLASGTPEAPIDASLALRTGHAFLADIAHTASPLSPTGAVLAPDADTVVGGTPALGFFDNELLDAHYIAGDGRANENIALTAVHHVFHAEHNRLVEHTKAVIEATGDENFIAQWKLPDGSWNGERLFQAARFGTEMQYQHLVFEEFARKIQPQVDIFFAATQVYDTEIDPSIVAEFAHTVYRFGHSMLTETVDRYDPMFNVVGDSNPTEDGQQHLGLIAAFLNPLEFAASGPSADEAAGALVRGLTRQQGNEIDEFVTEALRNNLLGLPLDLASINIARGRDTGVPSLNAARRDFYEVTGDSQLKPYASWVEFAQNIKHPASVVNFIAAYGTHETITGATSIAAKRTAATNLVLGNPLLSGTEADAFNLDRFNFLNSIGAYAPGPDGVTVTGVDAIDFWIGGLAEKQMPFGGMLGSTFNFVFEEQMEKLQDGDRFYYLERTQGLNFLTELENNSFARMVMANTDAIHLPGDIFSTPGFILEVEKTRQFTGLGDGRDDPTGEDGKLLVRRDNPATEGPDPNYLRYTGEDHVVLGGTSDNDTIIASLGDDTLYGDDGDDRLEGGHGNDMIFGGAGDDIITDLGGDDNLQGGDGNDAIHGGNGANLILGGFGNDFIVTGEDPSEAFGGPGNDFILGARGNEMVFGNEGDDWIELGMSDGSAGENFDEFGRDEAVGHDVFIGNTIADRMDGEGGDDIMVGNGGQVDRYAGGSGFDWANFKDDPFGVTADLTLRAFDETPVPQSNATVLARFSSIEGISGSAFADVLRGDNADAAAIALSGAHGSVLLGQNIGLIDGLQEFLNETIGVPDPDDPFGTPLPVTSFGSGNIILGGAGSDILEGRGGDDIIDGDRWLNVQLEAPHPTIEGEYVRANSMRELQGRVFSGELNPGEIRIVRELIDSGSGDVDTAVFSDVLANYEITTTDLGYLVVTHLIGGLGGTPGPDGTDTLRNVERLQFSDTTVVFEGFNSVPDGMLTLDDMTPAEADPLTVSALGVTDADNISETNPTGAIDTGLITYFWQKEVRPGVFEDIVIENAGGEEARATGPTFTPRTFEVGLALRVRAIYQDAGGVLENVFSAATAPVANANIPAAGEVLISDVTPTEMQQLQAINQITDADGLPDDPEDFAYQWQRSELGGGGTFTDIPGATDVFFTPAQSEVNRQLRVVVSYTDEQGHEETVTSAPTIVVGDFVGENPAAQVRNGNAGQDMIFGGGGADTLNGNAEDDLLDGGEGADRLNGGTGNDTLVGGAGDDELNGGADADTLTGGAGDDTVRGGVGDDRFVATAGDGNDTYSGGSGSDTYDLSATASGATVTATSATSVETGTDVLSLVENVIGSQGDDTITPVNGPNLIHGQGGNDIINAGSGADTVFGGLGNDTITGGTGSDVLNGNDGDDTFIYVLGDGADFIDGGAGTGDRVHITGTAAAQTLAVVVTGSAITMFAGTQVTGVEAFTADLLDDLDTLSYSTTSAAVAVNLAAGTATGFTSIANIERVTGGSGDDVLIGDAEFNTLNGGAGADTITGGGGNDSLNGGAGNDVFVATAGDGNDTYAGGGGTGDTYDLSATAAAATVNLSTGTASSAETGFDTLTTIERVIGTSSGDNLTGSGSGNMLDGRGGADIISGGQGADVLNGGAGDDTINGDTGPDVITGGADNDTVNGGDGNDRFVATIDDGNDSYIGGGNSDTYDLSGTSAPATVDLAAGTATSAQTGSDTLATVENVIGSEGDDTLTGSSGGNRIDGSGGADTINAGSGNDRIIGGLGDDFMNSGPGNDTFEFGPGFGQDTISGFDASPNANNMQDRLDVTALGINADNFDSSVTITDLGSSTLISFAGMDDTILLLGVSGVGENSISASDFILAA